MAKDPKTGKELPKGISWKADKETYMARFTYQGEQYCFYGKDLKDLKTTLSEKRYEVEHGLQGKADKISLNRWYQTWMQDYKIPTIKESTAGTYAKIYENHLRHTIGMKYLSQIKPIHIQRLYNSMVAEGLSAKYITNINAMLYNIMDLAVKNDLIMKNPVTGVTRPKVEKKERRVLSIEEQKVFVSYLQKEAWKPYEPLMVTLLGTGLRIGEGLGLTWNDVNFTSKQISIDKTLCYIKDMETGRYKFVYQTPKSRESIRTIPMQSEVEKALKRQRTYQKRLRLYMGSEWKPNSGFEGLVFTSLKGTPKQENEVREFLNKIVAEINSDEQALAEKEHREPVIMGHLYPHALRHTFATRCFEVGLPPKTVQEYLGHSSLEMTMDIYTHVSEEKKRKDMEKLNSIFKIS